MSDYIVRELKPEELLEGVKILLQYFGYSLENAEVVDSFWKKSFNNNMAKFLAEASDYLL